MSSETYDELGGLGCPPSYVEGGAWWRVCPDCGAEAGTKCTRAGEEYRPGLGMVPVVVFRKAPCIARQTGAKQ